MSSLKDYVYLDHAATTWQDPRVTSAVTECFALRLGNASSLHPAGSIAGMKVEKARAKIAKKLGCTAEELYFFSTGTEANNFILRAFLKSIPSRKKIIVSSIEHSSILGPARALMEDGMEVDFLPVCSSGFVNPADLASRLSADVAIVSVAHSNNEVGSIQNIAACAEACRKVGVLFHTDACQSFGKESLNLVELGVDAATISAHKMHGPLGAAALFLKKGLVAQASLQGGGQEFGLRPGTLNVPAIVGFGAAADCFEEADSIRMRELTDNSIRRLLEYFPGVIINSPERRLCGLVSFTLPGHDEKVLAAKLGLRGICVSNGAACQMGKRMESHVLTAMGRPETQRGAIRISISKWTKSSELDMFFHELREIVRHG